MSLHPPNTAKIQRDAEFYLFWAASAWSDACLPDREEKQEFSIADARPKGLARFDALPIPGAGPEWQHSRDHIDESALPRVVPKVSVELNGKRLEDIWQWVPYPIVSEKFKTVAERVDAEGSYFVPTNLFDRSTGKAVPEATYFWILRNELTCFGGSKKIPGKPRPNVVPFTRIMQLFMENTTVRAYTKNLKFVATLSNQLIFSREFFQLLKSEGITGLVEVAGDELVYGESVGHA